MSLPATAASLFIYSNRFRTNLYPIYKTERLYGEVSRISAINRHEIGIRVKSEKNVDFKQKKYTPRSKHEIMHAPVVKFVRTCNVAVLNLQFDADCTRSHLSARAPVQSLVWKQ